MPKPLHIHEKLHKGYGWKPGLPNRRYPLFSARVEAAALPPKIDLRPHCPPVYDQGQLGSCTGNAWAGALEFLRLRQKLADFVPSRLFIYYNERVLEHDAAEDAGASIGDGAHVVSTQGCPPETEWPYDPAAFAQKPSATAYQDGKKHLALQVQQVTQSLASMKEILAEGLPIVVGFSVYESFESDEVTRTGVVPMPGHAEKLLGGHCVVLVGYDDSSTRFIARNSWGSSWGMAGYFTIPYAYLTNHRLSSDFWFANQTE